jgi:putative ABC transport system ATP-binding protein
MMSSWPFLERRRNTAIISLINLTKQIQDTSRKISILNNIELHISDGEFVSIMGPSGSGKSTLLNILGLLDNPTSGEYRFEGTNIHQLNSSQLADFRNQKIGFIFQSFMLIPRLSVKDNVEVPLLYTSLSGAERKRRIEQALEQVGMTHKKKEPVVNLSGGQKQKVAIARAIINGPDLLLADEPTGNLDMNSKQEILAIFHALHRMGKTIVMVTHDREVAEAGERLLTMKNGGWATFEHSFSSDRKEGAHR